MSVPARNLDAGAVHIADQDLVARRAGANAGDLRVELRGRKILHVRFVAGVGGFAPALGHVMKAGVLEQIVTIGESVKQCERGRLPDSVFDKGGE